MIAYIKPSGKLFVGSERLSAMSKQISEARIGWHANLPKLRTKRDPETQVGISGACKLYPLDELPAKLEGGKIVIDRKYLDTYLPQTIDRPVSG